MKKVISIIVVCFILVGCGVKQGAYEQDLKESKRYTEEEREAVIPIIVKGINEFPANVTSITYAGDETSKRSADYYQHKDGMVFYVDFHTGHFVEAMNKNADYKMYQVLVYKDEQNKWKIDYAGCGYG